LSSYLGAYLSSYLGAYLSCGRSTSSSQQEVRRSGPYLQATRQPPGSPNHTAAGILLITCVNALPESCHSPQPCSTCRPWGPRTCCTCPRTWGRTEGNKRQHAHGGRRCELYADSQADVLSCRRVAINNYACNEGSPCPRTWGRTCPVDAAHQAASVRGDCQVLNAPMLLRDLDLSAAGINLHSEGPCCMNPVAP
jgi:hypothetical protein